MFTILSCVGNKEETLTKELNNQVMKTDTITLGAGCFWCVEAIFTEVKGVESVMPGYAGGESKNPTYKEVCEGNTGHAEVAKVIFDADLVTVGELLEIFWKTHDPTTLNRQGNDVGSQYRSVIFYHNDEQRDIAEKYKNALNESEAWENPVITEIAPINNYSDAENYHKDYYAQNGDQQYCKYVIQPKVEKFRKVFSDKLK